VTYSFAVTDQTQREAMARKTVELSELGNDVWHAVNLVCVAPKVGKRGDETAVSYQTAVVVDIDICSDAHKSDNLAVDFEEAKSFLPFPPSILVDSGYGLHAYYIWTEPLAVTGDNREEIKRRNNLLIDVVRQRANGKKIDGVGDLPRILRTPGTCNYKLGKENAPLCHVVEVNDVRFTPEQLDEKLNAIYVEQKPEPKPTHSVDFDFADDNPDLKEFRIRRMLDFISVVDGEYEKWLSVGMALKNEDLACSLWEDWSRTQPEYKEGECESKWQGFNRPGYGIGTLYQYAVEGGYDEKETRREWKELQKVFVSATMQKKFSPKGRKNMELDINNKTNKMQALKEELRAVNKALYDFAAEKDKALEHLSGVETFDNETIFSADVVTAAAFARLFDSKAFSDFKGQLLISTKNQRQKSIGK
jgi:Primase C terminal 2 (PriCT-2).